MSNENKKYNLNPNSSNNMHNTGITENSGTSRKFLIAKRKESRRPREAHNTPLDDRQPRRKRPHTPEEQDSYRKRRFSNYISETCTSNSCQSTEGPINLAASRLQNLRKSLQIKVADEHKNENLNGRNPQIKESEKNKIPQCHSLINTPAKNQNFETNIVRKRISQVSDRLNMYKCTAPSKIKISDEVISSVTTIATIPRLENLEDCENMEWSPLKEDIVIENVNEIRKEINYSLLPATANFPTNDISSSVKTACRSLKGDVHVVVDTNIFLSQLGSISLLIDSKFSELGHVIIIVPWMVIQELDYMKEANRGSSMCKFAQKAIHYINEQLASKNPQFKGQSVLDASKCDLTSNNADDGILFCCLQLVGQGKHVILLSNDVNLRNKVLINNIEAYSSTEIINNVRNLKQDISDCVHSWGEIKSILSDTLTYIIENELNKAFGTLWRRMAKFQPPFSLQEALNCMNHYWRTVFSFSLQKQSLKNIQEIIAFLNLHQNDENLSTSNFNKFVEYALSLCIYLKNGYKDYKNKIIECTSKIQKCAE